MYTRLADDAFGHEERSLVLHQANPLTKSLYSKAKKLFPDAFQATAESKFRSPSDIIPYFLALFTGFHDGTTIHFCAAEYPTNIGVQVGDDIDANHRKIEEFHRGSYELFFIIDKMSDCASPSDAEMVANGMKAWMSRIFPEPSEFEIDGERPSKKGKKD